MAFNRTESQLDMLTYLPDILEAILEKYINKISEEEEKATGVQKGATKVISYFLPTKNPQHKKDVCIELMTKFRSLRKLEDWWDVIPWLWEKARKEQQEMNATNQFLNKYVANYELFKTVDSRLFRALFAQSSYIMEALNSKPEYAFQTKGFLDNLRKKAESKYQQIDIDEKTGNDFIKTTKEYNDLVLLLALYGDDDYISKANSRGLLTNMERRNVHDMFGYPHNPNRPMVMQKKYHLTYFRSYLRIKENSRQTFLEFVQQAILEQAKQKRSSLVAPHDLLDEKLLLDIASQISQIASEPVSDDSLDPIPQVLPRVAETASSIMEPIAPDDPQLKTIAQTLAGTPDKEGFVEISLSTPVSTPIVFAPEPPETRVETAPAVPIKNPSPFFAVVEPTNTSEGSESRSKRKHGKNHEAGERSAFTKT